MPAIAVTPANSSSIFPGPVLASCCVLADELLDEVDGVGLAGWLLLGLEFVEELELPVLLGLDELCGAELELLLGFELDFCCVDDVCFGFEAGGLVVWDVGGVFVATVP